MIAASGFALDQWFFFLLPLGIRAAAERNADAWLGVVFANGDARINTTNLVSRRLVNLAIFVILAMVGSVQAVLAFSLSKNRASIVFASGPLAFGPSFRSIGTSLVNWINVFGVRMSGGAVLAVGRALRGRGSVARF